MRIHPANDKMASSQDMLTGSVILQELVSKKRLKDRTLEKILSALLSGRLTSSWLAAFLMGLSCRGLDEGELVDAARFLRAHLHPVSDGGDAHIDVCGTGGDKQNTLNVSTAVALLLGAMGINCVKHGGRSSSSQTGARDVLEALSIPTISTKADYQHALKTYHLAFLTASFGHVDLHALKQARKTLGIPTLFNFLGPLLNPAFVDYQLVGVFSPHYLGTLARASTLLGTKRVWSVCGRSAYQEGFIDEITLAGESKICAIEAGRESHYVLTPQMFGFTPKPVEAIRGGDPHYNAKAIEELMRGGGGAYRETVLMNAAVAMHICGYSKITRGHGREIDINALKDNVISAQHVLDDGTASLFLDNLRLSSRAP